MYFKKGIIIKNLEIKAFKSLIISFVDSHINTSIDWMNV